MAFACSQSASSPTVPPTQSPNQQQILSQSSAAVARAVSSLAACLLVASKAIWRYHPQNGGFNWNLSDLSETPRYPLKTNHGGYCNGLLSSLTLCHTNHRGDHVRAIKHGKTMHALNGNILSIIAFKAMLIYIIAIAKTALHPPPGVVIHGITSKYYEVPNAEYATKITMGVPYHNYPAKVISNTTSRILLVDTPVGLGVCQMLQFLAPTMPCGGSITSVEMLRSHLDTDFAKRSFKVGVLDLSINATLYNFVLSNRIDWNYIIEATPSWFVNISHPLVFDTVCPGCRTEPNWAEFFGRGAWDTTLNLAGWAAFRYMRTTYETYRNAIVARAMSGSARPPTAEAGWGPSATAAEESLGAQAAADALGVPRPTLIDLDASEVSDMFELAPMTAEPSGGATGGITSGAGVMGAGGGAVALGPTLGVAAPLGAAIAGGVGSSGSLGITGSSRTVFSTPPGVKRLLNSAKSAYARIIASERAARLESADAVARTVVGRFRDTPRPQSGSPFVTQVMSQPRIMSGSISMVELTRGAAVGSGSAAVPLLTSGASVARSAIPQAVVSILPKVGRRKRGLSGKKATITSTKPPKPTSTSTPAPTTSTLTPKTVNQTTPTVPQPSALPPVVIPTTKVDKTPVSTTTRPKYKLTAVEEKWTEEYGKMNMTMGAVGTYHRTNAVREKRQAGAIVGIALKTPSWVLPAVGVSVGWGLATTSLQTSPIERKVIHSITFISAAERYYIAVTSIILCSCFHNVDNRIKYHLNRDVPPDTINGRDFYKSDLVFDFTTGRAGDLLHRCSPLFKMPFEGMPRDEMYRSIAMLFDMSYVADDKLYYNGPPKFIMSNYQAYYSTTFPTYDVYKTGKAAASMAGAFDQQMDLEVWDPLVNHTLVKRQIASTTDEGVEEERESDEEDEEPTTTETPKPFISFTRDDSERGAKGASGYMVPANLANIPGHRSFVRVPAEYPTANWMAAPELVDSLDQLMTEPNFRYEFDMIQSSVYNGTSTYISNLRYFMEAAHINQPILHSHAMYKVPKGLNLRDLLRSLNPFDLSFPRLHIVRELLDGYAPTRHLQRVVDTAHTYGRDLKYMNLTSILAVFYAVRQPDDNNGIDAIQMGQLKSDEFSMVLEYLYTNSYARIPIVIVVRDKRDIDRFKSIFLSPVRDTINPTSWRYYSPFMVTTDPFWIQRSAYSLCISPKKSPRTARRGKFEGLRLVGSNKDAKFDRACVTSSMHVKYESDISAIATISVIPARILTFLSAGDDLSEWVQDIDQSTYDPGLSALVSSIATMQDETYQPPVDHQDGSVDVAAPSSPFNLPMTMRKLGDEHLSQYASPEGIRGVLAGAVGLLGVVAVVALAVYVAYIYPSQRVVKSIATKCSTRKREATEQRLDAEHELLPVRTPSFRGNETDE